MTEEKRTRKRILFVISQLHKGGAETSLVNLLKLLPQDRYDMDLLVMNQVPVEGAVSLIPNVPTYVNVCDAFDCRHKQLRLIRGMARRLVDNPFYSEIAIRFVEGKFYDLAIHVGEWWSPSFVANCVNAACKMAWIHTDIACAEYFAPDEFFAFDEKIDRYLFVSQHSMHSACRKYGFLVGKSLMLHNAVDVRTIHEKSRQPCKLVRNADVPLMVTVANIRPEKNHLLQLEAMHILQQRGRHFVWWNVGFPSFPELAKTLQQRCQEYGLEDSFLMLGVKENPYPYMAQADAVACLSNYESWSLSITEAKVLGIPVLATRTSGAMEQLLEGETGILTDTDPEAIAEAIEQLLFNTTCNQSIRERLCVETTGFDPQMEFDALLEVRHVQQCPEKRILYVIDDVLYHGGAHAAVFNHIHALLKEGKEIDVYSSTHPDWHLRNRVPGVGFYTFDGSAEDVLRKRRIAGVLLDANVMFPDKSLRMRYLQNRFKKNHSYLNERKIAYAQAFFSAYGIVCLMSEGSMYKVAVSNCMARIKIQWIHTDYSVWKDVSDYTRELSQKDVELWKHMDRIVVLSPTLKRSLERIYPQFSKKICVVGNLQDEKGIRRKAASLASPQVRFVSCFRFEPVKNVMLMLHAAQRLSCLSCSFLWTFIGEGEQWEQARSWAHENDLDGLVRFVGNQYEPMPLIQEADVFVQFSSYEGLPNSIYEALILGVPVLSSNVGAVSEQVTPGENGWLVAVSEDELYGMLVHIMENPGEIEQYKQNLKGYHYNNDRVLSQLEKVFNPEKRWSH